MKKDNYEPRLGPRIKKHKAFKAIHNLVLSVVFIAAFSAFSGPVLAQPSGYPVYPNQSVSWLVVGTGTETWTTTTTGTANFTTSPTGTFGSGEGTFTPSGTGTATVTYSQGNGSTFSVRTGSYSGPVVWSIFFDAGSASFNVVAGTTYYAYGPGTMSINYPSMTTTTHTAARTNSGSGSGTVNGSQGNISLGGFYATPQPQDGGTISGVSYSLTGNNPNIIVSFSDTANSSTTNASANIMAKTVAPPSISSSPQSLSVQPGSPANFSVTASGAGSLSYQWYFGSAAISGANGATFSIASVSQTNSGTYSVVVQNVVGSVLSASANLTVNKATPTITTPPAASAITYGQPLSSSTLSGGVASVAGTFAFTTPATTPAAGTASQSVTFTPSDTTDYSAVATSISVTVNKATPTITTPPAASAITYGKSLSSSTLSGGGASVAGTFAFTTPGATPGTGTASQGVTFTPSDTTDYSTITTSISVTVNKATPTITTPPTATAITYGQSLSSSTLSGGGASVAGTFAFTTPATTPGAGTASQSVTFTPSDTTDYGTVTTSVSVTVNKTTPTITTPPTASAITYGQSLSSSTLTGGVASVAGTFAFTTPATTPGAGTASQSVTFTPSDTTDYGTVATSISVTVNKATPTITTPPTASPISHGQSLSSSTLSGGVASVAGTFAFTTPGTTPGAGTASQSVTFTPSDTTDYSTVTTSISVTVNKATPTITTPPTASAITYGQSLSSSTLTGGVASVAGTFAFTTPTTAPGAGTASQSVTFTPSDATDYSTVVSSISVTVNKATPTITTAPTASAISHGQPLSSSTLSGGVASVAGTFAFTTPATTPGAGTASQSVTFTPSDTTDYGAVATSISVTVNKATPTITTPPTASAITYGQSLSSSTLSGGVASVAGTFAFTTPATTPGAGTASQSVTFTPSDTTDYGTVATSISVTVNKATPTITFCAPEGPFQLSAGTFGVCATSSSGLPVSFSSSTTGVCTVSGNIVTLLTTGTCTIQATQLGNTNYASAGPVSQSFTVGVAATATTVSGILPEPSLIGQSYTASYSVTSAGGTPTGNVTVSDGSASATCTVAAGSCALTSGTQGNKVITASYAGSGGFSASSANALHAVYATLPPISTVAGNGTAGYSGDSGTAVGAQLRGPKTTVADASGNLYIADSLNNRIRRVDGFTGLISTVAGTGTATYSGDGSAAVSAGISQPGGLVIDSSGNLYIADTGNNRIRKLTASTGVISTVAGNGTASFSGDGSAATSASINGPSALALDSSGNLYIADTGNNRVRKVTASTGVISTVAGNGTATFSGDGSAAVSAGIGGPSGVALDAANNVYIADTGNNRIREASAATGVISTIAGNGNAAFAGDNGSAVNASLNGPSGITLDSADNLYIADTLNNRVRKVDGATGDILTVAGTGNPVYNGDGGPAVAAGLHGASGVGLDLSGNLYISDTANQTIRKVGGLKFGQTITFPSLSNVTLGASPITVSATASSGLSVSFASTTASVCAVSGTTVTIVGSGLCSITASQAGNANYSPAPNAVQSFTVNAPANAATLILGNGTGITGQAVEIPIQLTSTGTASPAGMQLDLSFDTTKLAFTSARIGPQSTSAGKSLSQNALANGNERLLITGFNQNMISNGVVAYATFTLGAQFTSGTSIITPLNCSATDGSGNPLTTPCVAGTIRYVTCDIGNFGTTNVADVQLIINEALGVAPAVDDLNGDGVVNVADVQIVINAALGLGCVP